MKKVYALIVICVLMLAFAPSMVALESRGASEMAQNRHAKMIDSAAEDLLKRAEISLAFATKRCPVCSSAGGECVYITSIEVCPIRSTRRP